MTRVKIRDWLGNRSVFFKLLMIIILTAVTVNLAVGLFFRHVVSNPNEYLNKLLQANVKSILATLGDPPSLESARQIREDLGILIRYQGRTRSWTVSARMPRIHKVRFDPIHEAFGIRLGRIMSRQYVIVKDGDDYFTIAPEYNQNVVSIHLLFAGLLLFLTLFFVGVYFLLRKILEPIHSLKEGVLQVSEGNFNARIPVTKNDELGQLSTAFNEMTAEVEDQLHSKEQLLLNVSHELRSPLTRMKVALEMMEDSVGRTRIDDDIREMEAMITEILESARLNTRHGGIQKKITNLSKLTRDITRLFDDSQPGISLFLPFTEIWGEVDSERIKTVLKNLLHNAIKYSSDSFEPVVLRLEQKNGVTTIVVQDRGEGIPQEDLPFIFEPFYRVDKSRSKKTGGYGLGLSLCKKIIEAHNGAIEIQSDLTQGTRVVIRFPNSALL